MFSKGVMRCSVLFLGLLFVQVSWAQYQAYSPGYYSRLAYSQPTVQSTSQNSCKYSNYIYSLLNYLQSLLLSSKSQLPLESSVHQSSTGIPLQISLSQSFIQPSASPAGYSQSLPTALSNPGLPVTSSCTQLSGISQYNRCCTKSLPPPPFPDTTVDLDFLRKYVTERELNVNSDELKRVGGVKVISGTFKSSSDIPVKESRHLGKKTERKCDINEDKLKKIITSLANEIALKINNKTDKAKENNMQFTVSNSSSFVEKAGENRAKEEGIESAGDEKYTSGSFEYNTAPEVNIKNIKEINKEPSKKHASSQGSIEYKNASEMNYGDDEKLAQIIGALTNNSTWEETYINRKEKKEPDEAIAESVSSIAHSKEIQAQESSEKKISESSYLTHETDQDKNDINRSVENTSGIGSKNETKFKEKYATPNTVDLEIDEEKNSVSLADKTTSEENNFNVDSNDKKITAAVSSFANETAWEAVDTKDTNENFNPAAEEVNKTVLENDNINKTNESAGKEDKLEEAISSFENITVIEDTYKNEKQNEFEQKETQSKMVQKTELLTDDASKNNDTQEIEARQRDQNELAALASLANLFDESNEKKSKEGVEGKEISVPVKSSEFETSSQKNYSTEKEQIEKDDKLLEAVKTLPVNSPSEDDHINENGEHNASDEVTSSVTESLAQENERKDRNDNELVEDLGSLSNITSMKENFTKEDKKIDNELVNDSKSNDDKAIKTNDKEFAEAVANVSLIEEKYSAKDKEAGNTNLNTEKNKEAVEQSEHVTSSRNNTIELGKENASNETNKSATDSLAYENERKEDDDYKYVEVLSSLSNTTVIEDGYATEDKKSGNEASASAVSDLKNNNNIENKVIKTNEKDIAKATENVSLTEEKNATEDEQSGNLETSTENNTEAVEQSKNVTSLENNNDTEKVTESETDDQIIVDSLGTLVNTTAMEENISKDKREENTGAEPNAAVVPSSSLKSSSKGNDSKEMEAKEETNISADKTLEGKEEFTEAIGSNIASSKENSVL